MEFLEGLEDYAQPEIGLAVLAAAALFSSPRVRRGLRWGLVQGVAGVLAVGDGIAGLARQLTPTEPPAQDGAFGRQLVDEARVEQAKRERAHPEAGRS
jgi:hypothetical protein